MWVEGGGGGAGETDAIRPERRRRRARRARAGAAKPLCLKVAGNLRPSPSSEIRQATPSFPAQPSLTEATFSQQRQPDLDTKDITLLEENPKRQTP